MPGLTQDQAQCDPAVMKITNAHQNTFQAKQVGKAHVESGSTLPAVASFWAHKGLRRTVCRSRPRRGRPARAPERKVAGVDAPAIADHDASSMQATENSEEPSQLASSPPHRCAVYLSGRCPPITVEPTAPDWARGRCGAFETPRCGIVGLPASSRPATTCARIRAGGGGRAAPPRDLPTLGRSRGAGVQGLDGGTGQSPTSERWRSSNQALPVRLRKRA